MIVYNDIKRQFVKDVKDNSIGDKILEAIRMRGLNAFKAVKQKNLPHYDITPATGTCGRGGDIHSIQEIVDLWKCGVCYCMLFPISGQELVRGTNCTPYGI